MLGLGKTTGESSDSRVGTSDTPGLVDALVAAEDLVFALTDTTGRIVQTGGNFDRILGRPPSASIVGSPASEIIARMQLHSSDGASGVSSDDAIAQVEVLRASGETKRLHALTQADDGRVLALTTFLPGDGRMLTCLRDVSDTRDESNMLKVAMDAANAGYWSMDLQSGKFTYSDNVTARLSNRERNLIERNGLFSIIDEDDLVRISAQWQDIISGVAPFDLTYRVTTDADGLMWQRSIGQLQRRPDGKLIRAVAFVMDITADKKARADLEEAQTLARAKEGFMARMSHEIRTPLNAIIGMADSLSDEPMSAEVRDVVRHMEDAAESLHELLSRTLDHAKLDEGAVRAEFDPTDPRDILNAASKTWRSKVTQKGLEFRLVVAPDVPQSLPMDSFRLRQCLNNLIGNALKFTDTGAITLAARTVERAGTPHVAIIVQDTGIGMTSEDQKTVFNPYQQADSTIGRRFGGTGLGLSICRQLAALMGGEILLRSAPEKGSAFMLFLPLDPHAVLGRQATLSAANAPSAAPLETLNRTGSSDAMLAAQGQGNVAAISVARTVANTVPDQRTQTPERPGSRLPFEGLSVLCVEDNPVNQKVVERLIGGRVSQLHFAGNGREALSVLNTVQVDVVLMDIHMPVMDGIETTMEIRNSDAPYANVIIIALTADPDYQQMRICKNIGMDDTIAKPVRREDILEAFNRTLGKIGEDYGVRVALA